MATDDSDRPHDDTQDGEVPARLPLLPLRDVVLFPGAIQPLLVGRERSIRALKAAVDGDRLLVVVAQKEADVAEPAEADLYRIGTIARVHQMVRLPDGTNKMVIEGLTRARIRRVTDTREYLEARVEELPSATPEPSTELEALSRQIQDVFTEYVSLNRRVADDVAVNVRHIEDPQRRVDAICAQLLTRVSTKQRLLAEPDLLRRMRELAHVLQREIEILRVEERIEGEVKKQVEKGQKEYYLTEQLRAIRKELGYGSDDDDEIEDLVHKITEAGMPDEVRDAAMKEVGRLAKMAPMSPESSVIRNYLDVVLALPWKTRSDDQLDTRRVARQLDKDHYGLEKVKERILEFLSVVKLSGRLQGSILCLVGPPGVGKTSLGRSVAESMGRKFVRVSLGGVRDEAEIRGHRRTYIGSRPGRILEGMRKAGTRNPVFLLDEIDKLGADFRGDPSSALLEVLDPEQNRNYSDHYLEVPFDLSEVFFICTANSMHQIPPALEDRMEILRLPGYLDHEKVNIARDFLVPKLLKSHGLSRMRLAVSDQAILDTVHHYTREAGVRDLERQLARVCRKVARAKAERRRVSATIHRGNLQRFLGSPQYLHRRVEQDPEVGVVTGLAWTSVGGEILEIEVSILPGTGRLVLTGNLKEVMKESAKAALSCARSIVPSSAERLAKSDIHIHVPEGAVPKDGPSAGIAMATALVSVLTGRKVRRDVAMTGEITLRGRVLPIGGLPEKAVAAQRSGCRELILPKENDKDYRELPKDVQKGLVWHQVSRVEEVLQIALLPAETKPAEPRAEELAAPERELQERLAKVPKQPAMARRPDRRKPRRRSPAKQPLDRPPKGTPAH